MCSVCLATAFCIIAQQRLEYGHGVHSDYRIFALLHSVLKIIFSFSSHSNHLQYGALAQPTSEIVYNEALPYYSVGLNGSTQVTFDWLVQSASDVNIRTESNVM